ncbi:MAG: hypothetical protein U0559_19445 [Anaerolineae bacterium]
MKSFVLIMLTVLALTLTACGGSTSTAPVEPAAPQVTTNEVTPTPLSATYLKTDYADATSVRNQLALGTLKLEGTANAITAEQAKALLPLWQAMVALSGDTTTAEEELTAVQNQIVAALQPAQLQAIGALQLTTTQLNAFYAEKGIVMPTPVPGVTKVPGSGSGVSSADKEATRTAAAALGTPTGSGSGQAAKTALFDAVIDLLTTRSTQ